LAKLGLGAAPRDTLLLNNLAFALASWGRLTEAEDAFRRISPQEFDSQQLGATLLATKGLLLYRRGSPEQGRLHYERAVEVFRNEGDLFRAALAPLYHAREASLASIANAGDTWNAAQELADKVGTPEVQLLLSRLRTEFVGIGSRAGVTNQ